jgi:integrase
MEGVEPTRPYGHQILSLARLPIPPHRLLIVMHLELKASYLLTLRHFLRHCCHMKRSATRCDNRSQSGSRSSSRRYDYHKVLDNRKHPIRGLWRRNGKFLARITTEDDAGRKSKKWVPLEAGTVAEAQEQFRTLLVERSENRLRHIGRCPTLSDYLKEAYFPRLETSGKKADTLTTERGHLTRWNKSIGQLYLDKIRPHHITAHLQALKKKGRSNRTRNLALVMLRNVLKSARVDGFITTLPVDGIPWQRVDKRARRLYTPAEIESFCQAAFGTRQNEEGVTVPVTRNAQQFVDYIRLLAYTGAREQEAIKLRWADVDFQQRQLTIGADADTKSRECRRVDFNPQLEAHLKDMHARRAPDTQWIFPSPQRGDRDERAKTFRESLLLVRNAAKMPNFAFHDCRHHFISYAVMSGIDYLTIARWVGHKDGGVLIGKVYSHLSNEHAQAQAARLNFGPVVLTAPAVAGK